MLKDDSLSSIVFKDIFFSYLCVNKMTVLWSTMCLNIFTSATKVIMSLN